MLASYHGGGQHGSHVRSAVARLAGAVDGGDFDASSASGSLAPMSRVPPSRAALTALAFGTGCGDDLRPELALDAPAVDAAPIDAGVDAAEGPDYTGRYDEPGDFTLGACTPGSLAGFAMNAVWPSLILRTAVEAGELATYLAGPYEGGELRIEPLVHTDDALIIRAEQYGGLVSIYVCGADGDGRIRGSVGSCRTFPGVPELFCDEQPIDTLPITRLPGESEGEHLTVLGEVGANWSDRSTGVRVRGTTAYISALTDGVHIVDASDPTHPVERGHIVQAGEYANDIELITGIDGRLYAITASSPCNVIDVTDSAAPVLVAQLPFAAHTLWIADGIAYLVTGGSSKLDMWNVANPRVPVHLATWTHPDAAQQYAWHDVTVVDGLAYLSDQFGGPRVGTGLHVVDVSTPAAVQLVAREDNVDFGSHTPAVTTTASGRRLVLESSEWIGQGLRILDGAVETPEFLAPLGTWVLRPDAVPMHEVTPLGDRAYISHYRDGVRVLDISDPTTPRQVGYFNTWSSDNATAGTFDGAFALEVDPVTKRIYVADGNRGLVILEGDEVVFPLSSP